MTQGPDRIVQGMMQVERRNGVVYHEGYVEADGFRIRYVAGGQGRPVVMLHGADGLDLSGGSDLLAQHHHVIALELPGFGASPVNTRTRCTRDFARTVSAAADALGLERYGVVSMDISARIALWLALDAAERVDSLVLISPAAILPDDWAAPNAHEQARRLSIHQLHQPTQKAADTTITDKQRELVARVRGPNRDRDLEGRLGLIEMPALVVFGTNDEVIPPEMGRLYKEQLPNCYLVFVYDAGHAIAAQRPEALAGVVNDFLERHETFIVSRAITLINP